MQRPHWHKYNPWKDVVIYIPLEEVNFTHKHIKSYGKKLDTYLLKSKSHDGFTLYSLGIRYGDKPEAYLSPYIDDTIGARLWDKYRPMNEAMKHLWKDK